MWPKDLIDAFDVAFRRVKLNPGYTRITAIIRFLDTAASMAVWRCQANPVLLEDAYFFPYTPIGHLTTTGMAGTMSQVEIGGPSWNHALDRLKEVVRASADSICEGYKDTPMPYDHKIF